MLLRSFVPDSVRSPRTDGSSPFTGYVKILCHETHYPASGFPENPPPLAGQFISMIKDSSLLGVIAIRELTKGTREAVSTSLQPFELWFLCALLYLVLTFAFSMFVQYLEKKMVQR